MRIVSNSYEFASPYMFMDDDFIACSYVYKIIELTFIINKNTGGGRHISKSGNLGVITK